MDSGESTDDDFSEFILKPGVKPLRDVSDLGTQDDFDLELEAMLAEKKKQERKLKQIAEEYDQKIHTVDVQHRKNLKDIVAAEQDGGNEAKAEREQYLPLGIVSCFSRQTAASKEKREVCEFPISGCFISGLYDNDNGSKLWNKIRDCCQDNPGLLLNMLRQQLCWFECTARKMRCPDDIAHRLIRIALECKYDDDLLIMELRDAAMSAYVSLVSGNINLRFSDLRRTPLKAVILQESPSREKHCIAPVWKPSSKTFIRLFEWAGMVSFDSKPILVKICNENDMWWNASTPYDTKLCLPRIMLFIEASIICGHFLYGSHEDVSKLIAALLLLQCDRSMSDSLAADTYSSNAILELLDALPDSMWNARLVHQVCCLLTNTISSAKSTYPLTNLTDEDTESSVDRVYTLISIVEQLPPNRDRAVMLKRCVLLFLLRQPICRHIPAFKNLELKPLNIENDHNNEYFETVSDKNFGELLLLASSIVSVIRERVRSFFQDSSKCTATAIRCIIVEIRFVALLLHKIPQINEYDEKFGRAECLKLYQAIYDGLEDIFYRLPKSSPHAVLLSYVNQLLIVNLEKHKRFKKKRRHSYSKPSCSEK